MVDSTAPRLVAFDLDDTLAPSKSPIDPRIGDLLVALAERVEVAIISGGQLAQFTTQVVDRLPDASASVLERIHLLPTCGTQYYRLSSDGVVTIYQRSLTDDQKSRALAAVESEARRLGFVDLRVANGTDAFVHATAVRVLLESGEFFAAGHR